MELLHLGAKTAMSSSRSRHWETMWPSIYFHSYQLLSGARVQIPRTAMQNRLIMNIGVSERALQANIESPKPKYPLLVSREKTDMA